MPSVSSNPFSAFNTPCFLKNTNEINVLCPGGGELPQQYMVTEYLRAHNPDCSRVNFYVVDPGVSRSEKVSEYHTIYSLGKNIGIEDYLNKRDGKIEFHGVERKINVLAEKINDGNFTNLTGEFSVNLTDYLIERPSLLLRKIDDEIFIKFEIYY